MLPYIEKSVFSAGTRIFLFLCYGGNKMEKVLAKNDLADGKNGQQREMIRSVPLSLIDDFPEHPFKVKDDEEMGKLKDSISLYGVLTPVVARRCENGRYELISGHRRKYACKALGIEFMPAIVREISREEAVIAMVDSNLQREHILPSEKAFAYKMKLEAIKCQGKRNDLTSTPLAGKLGVESADKIGEQSGESADQVRRYIRLTELVPELLELSKTKYYVVSLSGGKDSTAMLSHYEHIRFSS